MHIVLYNTKTHPNKGHTRYFGLKLEDSTFHTASYYIYIERERLMLKARAFVCQRVVVVIEEKSNYHYHYIAFGSC